MTICVSAITAEVRLPPFSYLIVNASDTKISFGSHSAENTVKCDNVHDSWGVMMSGADITQSIPVIERARELLHAKVGTFALVKKLFNRAYQEHLREVLTDGLLSPFGMSLETFKKSGAKELSPPIYHEIGEQIRNADLGCTFLVYGFDEKKRPHIFTVENPGRVAVYDKPGFCAIGSGTPSALAMLSYMGQAAERSTLSETIYNVLAAKYMSEGADGVGRETFFYISKFECSAMMTHFLIEPPIRNIWETLGRPKRPAELNQVLETINNAYPRFLNSKTNAVEIIRI